MTILARVYGSIRGVATRWKVGRPKGLLIKAQGPRVMDRMVILTKV